MIEVSVLILTKNEEQDLPGCLQSVAWSDDIHIFDSGSSDATLEIAKQFGALITSRDYGSNNLAFGGDEGAHRTWGLRNIAFKYPWVFVIDADERMTPDLVAAIKQAAAQPAGKVAFSVQRRDFFLGTWLKHVQTSPFYVRLFRFEKVHYERLINCKQVIDGEVGTVSGYLDHYPFSKGMNHWLDRHNGYSRFEAQQIVANRAKGGSFSLVKAFTAKDFHERRYHQKELFYRLPLRPVIKFLLLYIGKRGFLDGRAGLTYATLQSIYEYFIVLKTRELEEHQFHS
jgi:glycosyltransferase involved in cell wall biosynthesis